MEQLSYYVAQNRRGGEIDLPGATAIVRRYVGPDLRVVHTRKLYGGSINRVIEWMTDGQPKSVVAKLNNSRSAKNFRREFASLKVYRDHTSLPVPAPIACLEEEPEFDGSGLLMDKIEGTNLSEARVTPAGMAYLQTDLANHVIALHTHHRATYGSALEAAGPARWLDSFQPVIEEEFFRVRDLLSSRARWVVDEVVKNLETWLPEQSTPTLVHGDLWANNILVDDRHPDRPVIKSFIDVSASYCDPEYELAYLRMFNTVDQSFFDQYRRRHPLRPGFSRRCRVYWLNTMMMHVRVFGERYVGACEQLATQLKELDR